MQWLKRVLPPLLVLAAVGVVIAALLSDHSSARGEVPLPQGGMVSLPQGKTTMFVDESKTDGSDSHHLESPLAVTVTPAGGGEPLEVVPESNEESAQQLFERSEAIGSRGAIASVDAPQAGSYAVRGAFENGGNGTLSFGTTSFAAVAGRWKVLAALIGAAILISLMPLPKRKPRWAEDGASGASASGDYQPPRFDPYSG